MNKPHRLALRWARTLHVYLTLFGFVLLFVFAVTGFMLNHESWFLPRQTVSGVVPTAWLGTPLARDRIQEKLRDDFGVAGDLESFDVSDDALRIVFKSEHDRTTAVIRRADGATEIDFAGDRSRERMRIVEGTMPLDLLKPNDPSKELPIVERLRKEFYVRGEVNSPPHYEKESEVVHVVFKAPGYLATAAIRASDGQTRVVHQSRGLSGIMLDLHRGKDSGDAWSFVIDALAILFVVVSITGFVLWTSLRSRAQNGLLILLVGTAVGLGVYLVTVPR